MGTTDNAAANSAVKNLQENSSRPSPLSGSVGFGGDNKPDDVRKVSEALVANGRLDTPTSDATDALHSKIITAQQDMADGLKPDGLVKPGGPTENRFTHLVQGGMMKAPAIPRPATGSRVGNAANTAAGKVGDVDAVGARALQNTSDPGRTSFQQAQDMKRLNTAKEDATKATARAESLDIKRREKAQHDQIMAAQKAHQQATQQTQQQSKQIKDTATKAIKGVVNLLRDTSETSPIGHSRVGESPTDGARQNDPGRERQIDSRLRGNDEGGVSDEKATSEVASPITDEVFSANRRSAQYLASRTDMQDFPRWEIEDINTQGAPAIAKTADLIEQTHDLAPDHANRLYERIIIGINPEAQGMLGEMLRQTSLGGMWGIAAKSPSQSTMHGPTEELRVENDQNLEPESPWLLSEEDDDETLTDDSGIDTIGDIQRAAWINLTGSPQEVKDNLSELSKKYQAKGYTRAADNLDHFLHGNGKDIVIPRDQARKGPFIAKGEDKNRERLETLSFLAKSGKEKNNQKLLQLQDGASVTIQDDWDVVHNKWGMAAEVTLQGTAGRDDFLAEGRRDMNSDATFTATRKGNKIIIKGIVTHDATETYDFETDGLGHLLGAKKLSNKGLGHNFKTIREWDQTFEGTVDITANPNGNILSKPRIVWNDIGSKTSKP